MRLLKWFRKRAAVLEPIVATGKLKNLLGPLPVNDFDLLTKEFHAEVRFRKRKAKGAMLQLVPARPQTELDSTARDVVNGSD
jgi:hypothetical protein